MNDGKLYYVIAIVAVTFVLKFLMDLYKGRRRMIRLKRLSLVNSIAFDE